MQYSEKRKHHKGRTPKALRAAGATPQTAAWVRTPTAHVVLVPIGEADEDGKQT